MPSYTHTAGASQAALSASLSIPYPSGVSSGDLLVIFAGIRDFNGSPASTSPSGFTLLATGSPGTNDATYCYGRIADGTESGTVSFDTSTTAGQMAVMLRFPAPSGYAWPAIGTAFVGSTESSNAATTSTDMRLGARTVAANGNLGIQFGKKPSTGTVTAVSTTSGWTEGAWHWDSTTNIVAKAQYREISGNITDNDVTPTGNTATNATGCVTVEFAPVVSTSISVDDATIDPLSTTVVTITKSAVWNGTVTAAIEGSAITLTDINTTQKSITLDIDDLLPGGAWNAISPLTTATLAVTDDDGTYTTEVQIVFSPSIGEDYVASPGVNIGTYLAVPGAVAGDPHFAFWHLGDGARDKTISGTTDAGTGYFAPITLPSQGRLIAYDVSAGAWLDYVDTELFSVPSGGGERRYRVYVGISVGV